MLESVSELPQLLLLAAAGTILIAGAAIDLYLLFSVQRRAAPCFLRAQPELKRSAFTLLHALQVLLITLLFAVPAILQKTDAPPPPASAFVLGPILYAMLGLLAVSACLAQTGQTFRTAFLGTACTSKQAILKGVQYGLAAIPPVILLSHVLSICTESLGYEPRLQEVFDWLGDPSIGWGVRLFMMLAAVFLAPLAEEALFRGVLFPALIKNRSFASAALLSGLYFALVHLHAPSLLPLLALSVAFSAAYAATGSLLTPIVMHALFNATSLLLYLADKA
jgi:membrane protease YdiL (CAAX protease family)